MLSKLVEKTKFLMTQYWPEVGKIAHLLERDNIVNGRDVSSLIGLNVIDRATPFLVSDLSSTFAHLPYSSLPPNELAT